MTFPANPRVAVVGATGAVGRVMLDILAERRFPASEVIAFASARSEGLKVPFGEDLLTVRMLDSGAFETVDLAVLDTPDQVAETIAPQAVAAGAVVIDKSGTFRMRPDVPLVVPEMNPESVLVHNGIISSPNCTTVAVVTPLASLHRRYGLTRLIVSSYQATSGAGRGGVEELREQSLKLVSELDALGAGGGTAIAPNPELFAAPIAFNILPQIGSIRDGGFTSEEEKLTLESRKIMSLPDLVVTATCVRVPTVTGHGVAVYAEFSEQVDVGEAEKILASSPGVEVVDLPNALQAAGTDPCYVGRIRQNSADPTSLCFFTVSDNLRKGAALNAVQIAELLLP